MGSLLECGSSSVSLEVLCGTRANVVGIAYGGVYGLMMAAVLEAVPRKARGIVGGFTQQGFAAGYMLASAFHLAMCKYELVET